MAAAMFAVNGTVALTQFLYYVAISRLPVGIALIFEMSAPVLVVLYVTAGLVATVEPAFGSVVAWLWLDQVLSAWQVIGGVVVLVGIRLAQTARQGRPPCFRSCRPRWPPDRAGSAA